MKKIWQFLLAFFQAWRKQEERRIVEELEVKKSGQDAVQAIHETVQVDKKKAKQLDKRVSDVLKRGKDLGLVLLLALVLPLSGHAQTVDASGAITDTPSIIPAEERIQNYTHDQLKFYAREMVDLVRQQQEIISDLQKQNVELATKLDKADKELKAVGSAIAKLSPTAKPHGMGRIMEILLRYAPAVLAGVAAIK